MPSDPAPDQPADALDMRRVRRAPSASTRTWHRWFTVTHVYISMVCLMVVLFFAITGITLNHPTWGGEAEPVTVTGELPTGIVSSDGGVNWLDLGEYLRSDHAVRGSVEDYGVDGDEGNITYKGPGYSADAFFSIAEQTFDLTVTQQGFISVMNDLHKGRDSRASWKWLIDVSGGLLALISLSGIGLQWYLHRRRRSAYVTAGAGIIILVLFVVLATR